MSKVWLLHAFREINRPLYCHGILIDLSIGKFDSFGISRYTLCWIIPFEEEGDLFVIVKGLNRHIHDGGREMSLRGNDLRDKGESHRLGVAPLRVHGAITVLLIRHYH